MGKDKKTRKFIDVSEKTDFEIKAIANNLSIIKGRTVTEKELLLIWIHKGIMSSLKKINNDI